MIEIKNNEKFKADTLNSSFWSKIWIDRNHKEWVSPNYFALFSYSKSEGRNEAVNKLDCLKKHIIDNYKRFVYKADKVIISIHTMKGVLHIDYITRNEHPNWLFMFGPKLLEFNPKTIHKLKRESHNELFDFIKKADDISLSAGDDRQAANILLQGMLPVQLNQLTNEDWLNIDKHPGLTTLDKLHSYVANLPKKGPFNNIEIEKFYRDFRAKFKL